MISEMPGPIGVRLSGIVWGRWVIVLSQKKNQKSNVKKKLSFLFSVLATQPYLIYENMTTLSALRTVALRHIYLIWYAVM